MLSESIRLEWLGLWILMCPSQMNTNPLHYLIEANTLGHSVSD